MGTFSYLARRFVAGESIEQAILAVRTLNVDDLVASLDLLGEDVSNPSQAQATVLEYTRLLEKIACQKINSNVSLKLTQLGLKVSEDFCVSLIRQILQKAWAHQNFVRIDMEGSQYTERTLNIFYRLFSEFKNVGIVIQAYLYRSENDAIKLASLKAPVRVCKGAYKEPSSIAFQGMEDIRRNYKILVETLLKSGSKVGIATHDERLIQWVLDWTQKNQIPKAQFEFQMLYGLRRSRARQLAAMGYIVRTYVPYGSHWLPYFIRRLRERKENVLFVLKSLVSD